MEGRLLLDVVVLEGSSVLELLAGEDESLLIWGNSFLILDLGLDGLNGVGLLDFESDGFTGEGFDEDLHILSCCSCSFFLRVNYNLAGLLL